MDWLVDWWSGVGVELVGGEEGLDQRERETAGGKAKGRVNGTKWNGNLGFRWKRRRRRRFIIIKKRKEIWNSIVNSPPFSVVSKKRKEGETEGGGNDREGNSEMIYDLKGEESKG